MMSRPVATTRMANAKTTKRPACRSCLVGFGWGRRLSIVTDGEPLLWLKLIKLLLVVFMPVLIRSISISLNPRELARVPIRLEAVQAHLGQRARMHLQQKTALRAFGVTCYKRRVRKIAS